MSLIGSGEFCTPYRWIRLVPVFAMPAVKSGDEKWTRAD